MSRYEMMPEKTEMLGGKLPISTQVMQSRRPRCAVTFYRMIEM